MKIKSILSIAAFSTAFIVSTFLAGLFFDKTEIPTVLVAPTTTYSKPTSCFGHMKPSAAAEKISVVLRQDDLYGEQRNGKLYDIDLAYRSTAKGTSYFSAYAGITSEYATKSGNMEVGGLPQEFQAAWRSHMKAWRDYANFLEDMKTSTADNSAGEDSFDALETEYNNGINSTWYEVLRVAGEYGSDFSPYNN